MIFAHLADCHIGSWREPKLKEISTKAFIKAIDLCINKRVDFILISGDLFNTSVPSIDRLKETVVKLKELKDKGIPIYIIAGSHDYSPSGKTMLDVLESAGMFINVGKYETINDKIRLNFTVDKKTGAKITGMLGRRAGLESSYYANLLKDNLENEDGYKIFLFHSAITEYKPTNLDNIESSPLSFLPKNFNYYAGGHLHLVFNKREKDYGILAYPGPLFPNNFRELEQLSNGGLFIVTDNKVEWEPIQIYNTYHIKIDCSHKTPEQVREEIMQDIIKKEFINTIVTIRLDGCLESGRASDIDFKEISRILYDKSAYFVMKNTNALTAKEFEEVKVNATSIEDVEDLAIKEHLGKINAKLPKDELILTKELMDCLNKEKMEGEHVFDFENRVNEDAKMVLGVNEVFNS